MTTLILQRCRWLKDGDVRPLEASNCTYADVRWRQEPETKEFRQTREAAQPRWPLAPIYFLNRYSLADLPVFLAKKREKYAGSVKPQISAISAMLMLV